MVSHRIHTVLIHNIKLFLSLNTCHWCILELSNGDLQIKIVSLHLKGCRQGNNLLLALLQLLELLFNLVIPTCKVLQIGKNILPQMEEDIILTRRQGSQVGRSL
jgi:2-phospho-L-lactate transferase/gluconeogenesis factor (CofD/UPF0052 family)